MKDRWTQILLVVLMLLLLVAALSLRLWVAPASRSMERAAADLVSASQQSMALAQQLDLAMRAPTELRSAEIDSLKSRVQGPVEREALTKLGACLLIACEQANDLAMAAKLALAKPLAAQRAALRERSRQSTQRQQLLFGLLVLALLSALGLYLRLTREAPALEKQDGDAEQDDTPQDALQEAYRKQLEQLYQVRKQGRQDARFAAFGEIAAGLSHGLKTPLACVRAATQVAQAKIGDEHPAQNNLDDVIDQVDDLVRQINRFLKTMGTGAPLLEGHDPAVLLAPLDERYRQGVPKRKVSWVMSIAKGVGAIHGDAELIEMALRNLIDNALEATGDESEVTLAVRPCTAPSRVGIDSAPPAAELQALSWTEIAILDRGPGISKSLVAREKIESTRDEGSGLGIAIASRIAARLGGVLLLASREDGHGTCASFVLPPSVDPSTEATEVTEADDLHR